MGAGELTDLNVKQQMAAKPWYERGLGVRGKLEKVPALYHLLRLAPGQVGIKPYVSWLTEERAPGRADKRRLSGLS